MNVTVIILAGAIGAAPSTVEPLMIPPPPAIPGAPGLREEPAIEPLVIPPPPAIPGAPEEPAVEPPSPEEEAARRAAAAASPRVANFGQGRSATPKPRVPLARVDRQQEIKLVPSEGRVADRNAMSESLRVMPADLRQPSNFDTVYEIDERPDVLVRANGAVYAVFPQGDYALAKTKKKIVIQTLIPAGTTFYIGEPDWRTVWLPGIRGMRPRLETYTAEEFEARSPPAGLSVRVEPTMPHDYAGVYLEAVRIDELPGRGPISARIETFIEPTANAFGSVPEAAAHSSSRLVSRPVPGRASGNADGTDAVDVRDVAPRLHLDSVYRRQRMNELLDRAARQGT